MKNSRHTPSRRCCFKREVVLNSGTEALRVPESDLFDCAKLARTLKVEDSSDNPVVVACGSLVQPKPAILN